MRTKYYIPAILIFSLLLMNSILALNIVISPTSISETLQQGQNKIVSINYNITNPDNSSTLAILNTGSFPSGYLNSDAYTISVPANSTIQGVIHLTFSTTNSTPINNYSGTLFLSSVAIPTTFSVTAQQIVNPIGNCKIYTLPIPLSKSLEVGNTASQTIDIYVSKYCASAITITSNQPVQQKPIKWDAISGAVEPSNKFTMLLTYDTRDVSRGTYTDTVVISGIDDNENQYSLTLPISVTVTGVISPTSNGTSFPIPSCSLSASSMNVNQTYTLICNNIDPNLEVQPVWDTSFFQGVYPYVVENANTNTYSFIPIKTGTGTIKANFLYKSLSIGQPFNQDVTILAGAYIMGGTKLALRFYPELYESTNGMVTVRVIDNATGNILDDSRIMLNGLLVNNNSLSLLPNQLYEIRASHSGYSDLVQTISLSPKPVNFTMKDSYLKGEVLNFSTQPDGAKILYDGNIITLPFTLNNEGTHTIAVVMVGYTETYKNFTVVNDARVLDSTITKDAVIGSNIFVTVSKNDSQLRISYKADAKSESNNINQTIGSTISIKAKDSGIYEFYADNNFLKSYTVEGSKFYYTWWFWAIIIFIVIVIIIIIATRKPQAQATPMSFNLGGG